MRPATSRGLALVRSESFAAYEAIAEACQAAGYSTAWNSARQPAVVTGASVALWDAAGSIEQDQADLTRFVRTMAGTPVIAVIGFPRGSDMRIALDCGAHSVVSKPYLLAELYNELARVTSGGNPRRDARTTAA